MGIMKDQRWVQGMYVDKDTLSIRIGLHDKYSVNKQGWRNWVFEQYALGDGCRVLELGCGTGIIWKEYEARLPSRREIVLTDMSPLMLDKARAALQGLDGFEFRQADIQRIPFEDAQFDAVIANHMLYHVPDIARALSEVARVLRPGGTFYATTLGDQSLFELNQLYRRFAHRTGFSMAQKISFTLENGPEQIAPWFEELERRDYVDALEVTSADDLMAYIQSYNDIPQDVLPDFRAAVVQGFGPDGVFRIRKEQGMFVARGPRKPKP